MDKLKARHCLNVGTDDVLDAVEHKRIKLGHTELLAGLDPAAQNKILAGIIHLSTTVSVLEGQIAHAARVLVDAAFETAQCQDCEHNSGVRLGCSMNPLATDTASISSTSMN